MKTQSENWFEEFCERTGLSCHRIAEEDGKTPDYELKIKDKTVIVEVKEITRNPKERESDRLVAERQYGAVLTNTPGDRVRKKINDSSAQIKARTQGTLPSILVLCDIKHGCGQITGHTDPYNIRVGMYGLEQIHISIPKDPSVSPHSTGMSYGPKRKMTAGQNTSISAIGVLSTPEEDDIRLDIYHNVYAAQPLDPALISEYPIRQYHLVERATGETAKWEEVVVA